MDTWTQCGHMDTVWTHGHSVDTWTQCGHMDTLCLGIIEYSMDTWTQYVRKKSSSVSLELITDLLEVITYLYGA